MGVMIRGLVDCLVDGRPHAILCARLCAVHAPMHTDLGRGQNCIYLLMLHIKVNDLYSAVGQSGYKCLYCPSTFNIFSFCP